MWNKPWWTLGAAFFILMACSDDREFFEVKRQDIVESVYSSVVVEPLEVYQVNALNAGYINEIVVEVGDSVAVSEVLFSVRDVQSNSTTSNAKLAMDQAQRSYRGDKSLLDDLRFELQDAALKLQTDSINYFRNVLLQEKGMVTEVELAQSEVVYSAAKMRYRLLKNRLVRTESDLKASWKKATNDYASSLSRSNDAVVRNRIKGQVYDLFKEPGEFVSVQEPVLIVGSKDRFLLKMKIDEVDVTKIELNQRIIISLEAYKDQVFDAVVTRISPKMDRQTQTFEVEGAFIEKPSQLYMGLTGEGNIIIQERKGVLVIPREYLVDDSYVITSDGKQKVTVGLRSLSHVEVLKGLKEGVHIFKKEE